MPSSSSNKTPIQSQESSFLNNIVNGITFGMGSSIGHNLVNTIMGNPIMGKPQKGNDVSISEGSAKGSSEGGSEVCTNLLYMYAKCMNFGVDYSQHPNECDDYYKALEVMKCKQL